MTFNRYNKILSQVTLSDIITLVSKFGVEENSIRFYNKQLIMPTCCHNDIIGTAKHKLYYYEDSKKFYCYTCCGSMDIFDFIINAYRVRGIKYTKTNAITVIEKIIQERLKDGFSIVGENNKADIPVMEQSDWKNNFKQYNSSVMNCFSRNKKYLKIWEKEGISFETMDKFGIKFDMVRNRMVIPIYNHDNIFVGAKVRNFNKEEIENGRKYMPLIHNEQLYTYDRGKVLYGFNVNKKIIKKAKSVIIFESEKSTLMYDSMFVSNRAVSIGGSNISIYQAELLKDLGITNIVLALDNDYSLFPNEDGTYDKFFGLFKMLKEANKLSGMGFSVDIIYDWNQEFLENKDAPIDKGRLVWNKLYRARKNFNNLVFLYKKKGEDNEIKIEDF